MFIRKEKQIRKQGNNAKDSRTGVVILWFSLNNNDANYRFLQAQYAGNLAIKLGQHWEHNRYDSSLKDLKMAKTLLTRHRGKSKNLVNS